MVDLSTQGQELRGDSLKEAFEYYLENQDAFVADHDGRYIVIHRRDLVGVYDDDFTAVMEGQKHHALGTFLVQKVTVGDAAYTITLHSREVSP